MAPPVVLVVEDDRDQAAICAAILQHHGYRVLCARNGAEALVLACEARPQVVLLDLRLPDMHGTEVFAALRQNPATAAIPVLVMTADVISLPPLLAPPMGFAGYLAKPFLPTRILAEIARLLAPPEPDDPGVALPPTAGK